MSGIWLPGFQRVKGMTSGSAPRVPSAPPRCVLHTDEVGAATRRLSETHKNPPQLWVNPKTKERYQIIDLALAGRALKRVTSLETNHMGRCVQVEIAGWAKDTHLWPAEWHNWLALEVMLPIHEYAGIPLRTWEPYRGGEAYGAKASQRMTDQQWRTFSGFCGHQHVPGNDHWDPGKLPVASMLATIQQRIKPPEEHDMTPAQAKQLDEVRREVAELRNAFLVDGRMHQHGWAIQNTNHLIALIAAELNKGGDPKVIAEALVTQLGEDLAGKIVAAVGQVLVERSNGDGA